MAEQAKILCAEAVENNLSEKVLNERWARWYTCRLCEQRYHGVVMCALGWACWKTYAGRPEDDQVQGMAMSQLGNGLFDAKHYEDALPVQEAELSRYRRLGAPAEHVHCTQINLANTYGELGHLEKALSMEQEVYSGRLKLHGDQHEKTLTAATNCASSLADLERFEEARALLRKTLPVAQRVLGENDMTTLNLRGIYGATLHKDPASTLDDLREAATTLEEAERVARRVLGASHPVTLAIGNHLRNARAALRARETPL